MTSNLQGILTVFDSWEPLEKARKAKGLNKWGKLQHIAHKLSGKSKDAITYTCAHSSHVGDTHVLGSVVGTLHFLVGYGNPGFHMAPYHWQIIDPGINDEEAEELHKLRGHPSRPELWRAAELEDMPEGDFVLGMPHPSAIVAQERAKRSAEGIRVVVGSGTYLAVPSEGLVYGEHNGHVYKWDLLRNSFMAAMNPSLVEAMDSALEEPEDTSKAVFLVPDMVKHHANTADCFDDNVYPFVKSMFPVPGSIIPLDTYTGEVVYGVVKKASVDFLDRSGFPISVEAWDRPHTTIDLTKGGNSHASLVYNFGKGYLNLDSTLLDTEPDSSFPFSAVVKGEPTPGFDDVSAEYSEDLRKSVERLEDGTYRLVISRE